MLEDHTHNITHSVKPNPVAQAREAVGQGDLEGALNLMDQLIPDSGTYRNQFTTIKGRFNNLLIDKLEGRISYNELDTNRNAVISSVVTLLDNIEKKPKVSMVRNFWIRNRVKFLMGPLIFGGVALIIFFLNLKNGEPIGFFLISLLVVLASAWEIQRDIAPVQQPGELQISWRSGLAIGLVGGLVAGIIIFSLYIFFEERRGILYILNTDPATLTSELDQRVYDSMLQDYKILPYFTLKVLVFASFVGGSITLLYWLMNLFQKSSWVGKKAGILAGSILGGELVGLISGLLGIWLFVDAEFQPIEFSQLLLGGGVGCFILAVGSVIYDYTQKFKYLLTPIIVGVLILFLYQAGALQFFTGLEDWLAARFTNSGDPEAYKAGMVIGSIAGLLFGAIVGISLFVFALFQEENKQPSPPDST